MTKLQRREHKIGNQKRREHFLRIYYKVKPASKSWIVNPGFIQKGKYATT